MALGPKPKLPMGRAPGKGSGLGLAQEPEVLVIKTPIMTTCRMIVNSRPIPHESWSLIGVATGINTHKQVKGLEPGVNRTNFLGFVKGLQS